MITWFLNQSSIFIHYKRLCFLVPTQSVETSVKERNRLTTVSGLDVTSTICYSGQIHNSMGKLTIITSNSVGSPICQ